MNSESATQNTEVTARASGTSHLQYNGFSVFSVLSATNALGILS
jgi:hypothetical protein